MSITELSGSPRESLNESSGSSAERKFLVPMSERIIFAEGLVGTAYPNFPQSRVIAIEMQPWSEDLIPAGLFTNPEIASADYGQQPCLVTVKYGPDYTKKDWPTDFPKPEVRTGTELRFKISGAAKFLLVPTSATKWLSSELDGEGMPYDDPTPVSEDANTAILVPTRAIQLQWDFVDNPPIDLLESLVGRVNDNEFLGSEEETILFEGYDVTETFRASATNPHTNRVTVNLSQRRVDTGDGIVGWNHDYRAEPAGWAKMLLSDGEPRYKATMFDGMFT